MPTPRRRQRIERTCRALVEPVELRLLLANFIVSNTLDFGAGSLRAAIEAANVDFAPDTISFSIGGGGAQTIAPLSNLPIITAPVTIDATTQPGYAGSPLITVDGSDVGGSSGLRIAASNTTVRGLRIIEFASNGIALEGSGAAGNVIEANEIRDNFVDGISISSSNNRIGDFSASRGNIITGNGRDGVRVTAGATGNRIIGNRIGVNASGGGAGNAMTGVTLFGSGNRVETNVICDNNEHGIHVSGAGASNNLITGNFIGTSPDGNAPLGNGQSGVSGTAGVRILGAAGTVIGGANAADANVISGNFAEGILIEGVGAGGATIEGNFIGTNAVGTAAVPNVNDGIQIKAGAHTIVRNVLSGNGDDGIEFQGAGTGGNVVRGNRIGMTVGFMPLGNGSDGIEIQGSSGNIIGGDPLLFGRNFIGGNTSDGIEILDDITGGSANNDLRGNRIGVGVVAQVLGNGRHGVNLEAATGTLMRENTIVNNGLDGVFVNNAATANAIRQSFISNNGGLGIDLGPDGVTPNDAGDADAGGNELQNFPTITSATSSTTGGTIVQFTLHSTPNAQFDIDIYDMSQADPSGFGEGARFVGTTTVTTDASGDASGSRNVGAVAAGQFVSATATNAAGSTSEFSAAVPVSGNDTTPPAVNGSSFLFDGATLPAAPHRLTYTFSENVAASLGANDLLLENLTTGATVPTANIAVSYNTATNTATFTFPGFSNGILPDGNYRATLLASGVTDPAGNPLPGNHVSTFFFLNGDANRDGRVNLSDFNILAANFGQSGRNFAQGDFTYDGIVNLADFNVLASRFGQVR